METFLFDLMCAITLPTVGKQNLHQIKIYYTGKLKESGHVFDSNVGNAAYKFLLGNNPIFFSYLHMINIFPSMPVYLSSEKR